MLGIASGSISALATATVAFVGISGGDVWNPDWTAKFWWIVPILFLGIDFLILSGMRESSGRKFQRTSYVLLTVVYILSMVATFFVYMGT